MYLLLELLSHQKQHRINFDPRTTANNHSIRPSINPSIYFLCRKTNGIQQSNTNTIKPDKQNSSERTLDEPLFGENACVWI